MREREDFRGFFDETKANLVETDDVQQCCASGDTGLWLLRFGVEGERGYGVGRE